MDIKPLLDQIDAVLAHCQSLLGGEPPRDPRNLSRSQIFELVSQMSATVESLTPDGHRYRKLVAVLLKQEGLDNPYNPEALAGILRSLRMDLEAGHLRRWEELVRAELFDSTIDVAEHLLEEGHKDSAAIMAGGALEVHLKGLCLRNGISPFHPPREGQQTRRSILLSGMGKALCKKKVVSALDAGNLRSWTLNRNQAAHGSYDEYDSPQVRLMIDGIRDFMGRYPA